MLACRKFDVDNDHRIRELSRLPEAGTVSIGLLSDEQVDQALADMGLDASELKAQQRRLVRVPLHLVLLATVANEAGALDFQTTSHLFEAFWDRKRRDVNQRRPGTRFNDVVAKLATEISKRQRLTIPAAVLDSDGLADHADVLVSEQVITREGRGISFFHEAFFDYAFARQWVTRTETLVVFLVQGEQELFRRAQVRQIMNYLREVDADRFVRETKALLISDGIRVHIKEVALAVLGGLAEPTSAELEMLLEVAAGRPEFEARLWHQLRKSSWFARFDEDGVLGQWLAGDDGEKRARSLELMGTAARDMPDRVAELLAGFKSHAEYPSSLRWVIRFSKLQSSRPLFDLFLEGVRTDTYEGADHELWMSTHDLADQEPKWAVEFLTAYFVEQPGALDLDDDHKVRALASRDHGGAELVRRVSASEPRLFCDALLPYMLNVMATTADPTHDGPGLPTDPHFSHRYPDLDSGHELADALFIGMSEAIRKLAEQDPDGFRPTLELLAADAHDAAQYLLYQGLLGGGETYADWSADLLLQDVDRLFCGYASNSVWVARLLLQSISRTVNNGLHVRLENAVRDLQFPWEGGRSGWYAFNLLSALEENRLSELGRRRLGEYRRRFETDHPWEPKGITGGVVGPPIPASAAQRMSDENWLGAMRKHDSERTDWNRFTGGARELSNVLQEQAKADPVRFARLALQMTKDINPSYGDAILMGLGEAPTQDDEAVMFAAIMHIASFEHAQNERSIGWSLKRYLATTPLAIVELVRDRAISSADPAGQPSANSTGARTRGAGAELHQFAINTSRGSLAELLGDLLVFDADGSRTALVSPVLAQLADDPVVAVRGCVAHTIAAAFRHARTEAIDAFWRLIDADDLVLTSDAVQQVLIFIGNEEPDIATPVVLRMLRSDEADVREQGGRLAAFAGLEWGVVDLLSSALESEDAAIRQGVAGVCAHRLARTSNATLAGSTLCALFEDPDATVRSAAAEVAPALRDEPLRPFAGVLKVLIASTAFTDAVPQLLLTLKNAPDRVGDLALVASQRFVDVFESEAGDIRTGAAGDASYVSELILRGLAQSVSSEERHDLLDVLDEMLRIGAYGVDGTIEEAER